MPSICCVVGCHNNTAKCKGKGIKFYCFPGRPWEIERRNKWILAVNRKTADGSLWKPKFGSRICSDHFINNQKSEHPLNPAYFPTVFPAIYRRTRPSTGSLERFHRMKSRSTATRKNIDIDPPLIPATEKSGKHDVSCQVRHIKVSQDEFIFESTFCGNDVATQAVLPRYFDRTNKNGFIV